MVREEEIEETKEIEDLEDPLFTEDCEAPLERLEAPEVELPD